MKTMIGLLSVSLLLVSSVQAHDIVLRNDEGKAVLGVSYPADWEQKLGKCHVEAVSSDGQVWSVISTLDDIKDKKAGVAKIKTGLEGYLKDIEYDELQKTERGSLIVSGVGKGKKSGVDVVFTAGIFESGENQLSAVVFILDADIEKYYEKTVLAICESVLVEEDFADEKEAVTEKVSSK